MARTAKGARSLREVLTYESPRVLRDFRARYRVERAELRSLFRELSKLLWLAQAHGVPATYPIILHELWRELASHTAEYERFCAHHFGRMLHFDPDLAAVDPRVERSDEDLESAIALVYAHLGKATATLWFDTFVARYPPDFFEKARIPMTGPALRRWERYNASAKWDRPSTLLASALRRIERRPLERRRFAIDLGCGTGRDTRELLARGWRVLAIDAEPTALVALLEKVPRDHRARLAMTCARFEDLERLPRCDLVTASISLPFCSPARFAHLWGLVTGAVRAGGRFAGQFFGERDDWASQPHMTFHSVAEVRELLAGFHVERLHEGEGLGARQLGGEKRWHLISVIARRKASA